MDDHDDGKIVQFPGSKPPEEKAKEGTEKRPEEETAEQPNRPVPSLTLLEWAEVAWEGFLKYFLLGCLFMGLMYLNWYFFLKPTDPSGGTMGLMAIPAMIECVVGVPCCFISFVFAIVALSSFWKKMKG